MSSPDDKQQLSAHDGNRYRELFENGPEASYTYDMAGRITAVNKAWERITGYAGSEAVGMSVEAIYASTQFRSVRNQVAWPSAGQTAELILSAKDGTRIPVEVSFSPIVIKDQQVGVHAVARDISERKRIENQLLYFANHDSLTGLLNRHRFEEELQLQLAHARRTSSPGTLFFIDLDHFKNVNDTLGHRAGDELLVQVSRFLQETLPEHTIVARLGGDEFTFIMPDTGMQDAGSIAGKLLNALRNHRFDVVGETVPMTASLGFAQVPPGGLDTAEELLSKVDAATYEAKENGRNRIWEYAAERDWQAENESRLRWRRRIARALEGNLLTLHAQPILDLRSDRVSQYELLLRLPADRGEFVNAADLVDQAQRFGLIQAIDRWAVSHAIQLLAEYLPASPDLVLEVNISGQAFADADFIPRMKRQFDETRCDPRHLVLEVTESVAIANLNHAQQFLQEVRGLGCKFALDDFGVGFSSFHQLKHLDVDYLKIDGSFIRNLARDPVDQQLVKAMVDVARALGKQTVAEFVADAEILECTRALGVDYAQGYYVGEPRDPTLSFTGERGATAQAA